MIASLLEFANNLADSPLQKLQSDFLNAAGVHLFIKRDDLIHPYFGGNKWRKLKYNLIDARNNHFDTLLTFGGAWSNHIYATAAAGQYFGFHTIGLIRGEEHTPLNPMLAFAEKCGMELHYLDRELYRQRNEAGFLDTLKKQFGDACILPEGGSNALAIRGCSEIVQEINRQMKMPFDVICCASGTGATLAGIIVAIEEETTTLDKTATGFSVLKGGEFLEQEVCKFLGDKHIKTQWLIESGFHFGGYARINNELIKFMHEFEDQYGITLDAVYTAKMFYGLFERIKSRAFEPETVIVAVHSGGIQGNRGLNLSLPVK